MKKIKKNVLKPFLFICLGLTITTIVFASARGIYDPPSPPGVPEVIDIWDTGCTLRYRAPLDDGGKKIEYYLIEYRRLDLHWDMDFNWKAIGTCMTLTYTVRNMIEGSRVQFRVSAVNEIGRGEPSKESDPIEIRNPF